MSFKKFQQQSLVDVLLDIMPELSRTRLRSTTRELGAAEALFNLWKNSSNKVSDQVYKKTKDLAESSLNEMQNAGLIKQIGDRLKITSKGSEIIKTMILGDDRSSFEGGDSLTYREASLNTKRPSKLKKQSRKAEDDWWKSLLC